MDTKAIIAAISSIQAVLDSAKKLIENSDTPSFEGLNLIRGRFEIVVLPKKYVGYASLKICASRYDFFNYGDGVVEIPDGFIVETDGILWSITKHGQGKQG